jgi:hypothetical protein
MGGGTICLGLTGGGVRTRRQTLLELLGLVGVLENKGVDALRASDLELDVVDLLVLLYACGWTQSAPFLHCFSLNPDHLLCTIARSLSCSFSFCDLVEFGMLVGRTASILAPADLDELLDV